MVNRKKLSLAIAFCVAVQFIPFKASAAPISVRLAGKDRYETAIKISQNSWNSSDYVVIAYGEDFPDGLSAAPLAKKFNAPILLTTNEGLPANVLQEIQRLGAKKAFIVGGTGVVSASVEGILSKLNIETTRLSGKDRYETSAKIAEVVGTENGAVIASGENFPDALSIAPIAAAKQMPILLTTANSMPSSIVNIISSNNIPKYYVIGGNGVIKDSTVAGILNYKRLSGNDRYETNLAVINEFSNEMNFGSVFVSTGEVFADALGGAAAAAQTYSPLVLTDGSKLDAASLLRAKYYSVNSLKTLGGTAVISDAFIQNIINQVPQVILGYATYYYKGDNSSYNSLIAHSDLLNQIATDTYDTDGTGKLTGLLPTSQLSYAGSKNIDAYAMVANNFDGSITKTLLENPSNRANLINNLLKEIRANNFKGVNIDLEGIYYYDRTYFTSLMCELYNALHPLGYKVTVAVPAKTSDSITNSWTGAYDYEQIGNYSDEVVIMTYDEHYAGGVPGPIASSGWVQSVINYAVKYIPRQKVLLGLASYGYYWPSN